MTDARKFKAGMKNPRFKGGEGGRMSPLRRAWAQVFNSSWIVYAYQRGTDISSPEMKAISEESDFKEIGETVRLNIKHATGRTLTINLTALTEQELQCVEEAIKFAIDRARPICRLRDKAAEDALAEGDDGYARSYRSVGQLVVRQEQEPPHS